MLFRSYGGGFATVPAYLSDIFGTQYVSAIHGRLLTAWSTAGIIGPVVVNYIREAQLAAGVPRPQVYNVTFYILAAMLVFGLIANALVRPLADRWFIAEPDPNVGSPVGARPSAQPHSGTRDTPAAFDAATGLGWLAVGIPVCWGVWVTISQAIALFS